MLALQELSQISPRRISDSVFSSSIAPRYSLLDQILYIPNAGSLSIFPNRPQCIPYTCESSV